MANNANDENNDDEVQDRRFFPSEIDVLREFVIPRNQDPNVQYPGIEFFRLENFFAQQPSAYYQDALELDDVPLRAPHFFLFQRAGINRIVNQGSWRATGRRVSVRDGDELLGHMTEFRFVRRPAVEHDRVSYTMIEYTANNNNNANAWIAVELRRLLPKRVAPAANVGQGGRGGRGGGGGGGGGGRGRGHGGGGGGGRGGRGGDGGGRGGRGRGGGGGGGGSGGGRGRGHGGGGGGGRGGSGGGGVGRGGGRVGGHDGGGGGPGGRGLGRARGGMGGGGGRGGGGAGKGSRRRRRGGVIQSVRNMPEPGVRGGIHCPFLVRCQLARELWEASKRERIAFKAASPLPSFGDVDVATSEQGYNGTFRELDDKNYFAMAGGYMVLAHTSAGKILVALYANAMSLENRQRVIYTLLIKALSNLKCREFKEEFSDVGLMTGDVTIDPDASCLVGSCLNWCSMQYRGLEVTWEVAWFIFDVAWNPSPEFPVLDVTVGQAVFLLKIGLGNEEQKRVEGLLHVESHITHDDSGSSDTIVKWSQDDNHGGIGLNHFKTVSSVEWHREGDYFSTLMPLISCCLSFVDTLLIDYVNHV